MPRGRPGLAHLRPPLKHLGRTPLPSPKLTSDALTLLGKGELHTKHIQAQLLLKRNTQRTLANTLAHMRATQVLAC